MSHEGGDILSTIDRLARLDGHHAERRSMDAKRSARRDHPRCEARTRSGRPCHAPRYAYRVGGHLYVCRRCRMHGGASAKAHRLRARDRRVRAQERTTQP